MPCEFIKRKDFVMRTFYLTILLTAVSVCGFALPQDNTEISDLKGKWAFSIDNKTYDEVILPGTTDTNRKGTLNENRNETTFLSRYYKFEGRAWYSKEVVIPESWNGKVVRLFMERTRPTKVWVDDKYAGSNSYLSTPHVYDLSGFITPGKHRITVMVDNGDGIPAQIRSSSHACTESTQTNWNGIIGRIELQALNNLHIKSVQVYPDYEKRMARVRIETSLTKDMAGEKIIIHAEAFNTKKKHSVKPLEVLLEEGKSVYDLDYKLGKSALLWSDSDPALYKLDVAIEGKDKKSVNFGLRNFEVDGMHFSINGNMTFLRGKHDACVFPLTGHTAMDVGEWRRYFRICKEYGINHCRFHSWCPPKACFDAADLEGIFLQPELPVWGSFNKESKELMDFLMKDGMAIQNEYSNHASFVLFALGNELSGDINVMKDFVNKFREVEKRHLYAYGSNIFLGTKGHVPGEDFLVTCRVGSAEDYSTHVRASFSFADAEEGGYLNNTYPNLIMNFDSALVKSKVPVIGHETGQFQTYPDFDEIKKYKGVLAPWNFEVFKNRLEKAGMADKAKDFFKASGAWSVELYRADIEMNLRSRYMSGFQLLDLQDYPGQGSAYVGILDAFMDSKGLIAPEKWREFCSEVVPLLVSEKYTWKGRENFAAEVKVANYGYSSLKGKTLSWSLKHGGSVLKSGKLCLGDGQGLLDAGRMEMKLPDVKKACKMELTLSVNGTEYRNSYPLWVYPAGKKLEKGDVKITRTLDGKTLDLLAEGAKVLLIPEKKDCGEVTVGGLFQTDYWNYRMFKSICDQIKKPSSPGTLGILTNPKHPLFVDFPTESHTNWQWYPVIKNSYPIIMDNMPKDYYPIVQVIDNVERNHKLGLIFEMKIGTGKLLICMADLEAAKNTPEGFQLYASILDYMNSAYFNPERTFTANVLKNLFYGVKSDNHIKVLENISYTSEE